MVCCIGWTLLWAVVLHRMEIGILMVALAVFALILLLTGIVLIVRMFFPEAFCSRMDTLRNGKY